MLHYGHVAVQSSANAEKFYQSSSNRNPSCCRLCGFVKDENYCENLFAEASKQLLAVAEEVYGRPPLRKVNEELRPYVGLVKEG